jgi:hypothetical protein
MPKYPERVSGVQSGESPLGCGFTKSVMGRSLLNNLELCLERPKVTTYLPPNPGRISPKKKKKSLTKPFV